VEAARTVSEEHQRKHVDEATVQVRKEALAELTAAPPDDKPPLTANGPTSRVVTRPSLSRTLDLSINRCVEPAPAAVSEIKRAPPQATGVSPAAARSVTGDVTDDVRKPVQSFIDKIVIQFH